MMESFLLIILVSMPGVWSGEWGVSLESQCALKGASVVIKCKYDYPSSHTVTTVNWYKALSVPRRWTPLFGKQSTTNRFRYVGFQKDCSLEINDVQPDDEGKYAFGFETDRNRWRSKKSASLSVKDLTTVIRPSTVTEGDRVSLTCRTGCPTSVNIDWFRDGQRVPNPDFQARREDGGGYYCAVQGQMNARSDSVALNVQYAPKKVTLSMSPSGDVVKGSSLTFTCSSDGSPPVTQSGYRLYKEGHVISSGQNLTISDVQPRDSGLYFCQAKNNISINFMNSTEVHLDVQYGPVNISILMDPDSVVEGSSVKLTCSSDANPAADNYTWYQRTASPSSLLQVGSGRLLSLPSVEASHAGFYLCRASNTVGEDNSTELLLTMKGDQHGSWSLPLFVVIGVVLLVTLVLALLLLRRRQRKSENTVPDLSLPATEDQSNNIYSNIHTLPPSPPSITAAHSQRNLHREYEAPPTPHAEDELTYSTVTIKPRNPSPPHHMSNIRVPLDSWSQAGGNDDSVIYATVAKSS